MAYSTERRGNVTVVKVRFKDSFDQPFLITSDRHWDNPRSLLPMQKAHLDEAEARKAGIIDIGDLFCAMQGKYDPRANKAGCRPEHQVDDYLDALVKTAADFFGPYARRFIRISPGNHETAVKKRTETDLSARLVSALNASHKGDVHLGGYSGWVLFDFEGVGHRTIKKFWYIHGYGGGGPVTKGVIQASRHAVYVPDADLVATGHIHEEWTFPIQRARLSDVGDTSLDEQVHFSVPTYKDEYGAGEGGWHVERGGPPKPLGAVWLTFKKARKSDHVETTLTRAK